MATRPGLIRISIGQDIRQFARGYWQQGRAADLNEWSRGCCLLSGREKVLFSMFFSTKSRLCRFGLAGMTSLSIYKTK